MTIYTYIFLAISVCMAYSYSDSCDYSGTYAVIACTLNYRCSWNNINGVCVVKGVDNGKIPTDDFGPGLGLGNGGNVEIPAMAVSGENDEFNGDYGLSNTQFLLLNVLVSVV
eukprot:101370_1